jgi:hypothetical protein
VPRRVYNASTRPRLSPRPSALRIDDRTVPAGDARGDFDVPTIRAL